METSVRSIPTLDIHTVAAEDGKITPQLGAKLDAAFRKDGFVSIVGHGISDDLISEMHDVSGQFFRLSHEEKMRYRGRRAHEGGRRGYHPMGGASARILGIETPPDLRETYSMSRTGTCIDAFHATIPDEQMGVDYQMWPEIPATMRDVWVAYYGALEALSQQLLRIMAVALGLEEGWFAPYSNSHRSTMSANYYPETPKSEILPNQMRIGPHTDGCSFVILYQDMTPSSLQIADRANVGDWRDVTPTPGSFVVNLGDTMARWTNELWTSTVHRAVVPAGDSPSRISIAFRFNPKHDTIISCIPGLEGPDGPKYEAMTLSEASSLRPSTY